jgi:dihydrofolate reductase
MRKIIAGAFVSLDGVMQAPGGPEEDPTGGFAYGGWTVNYWDEMMGEAMAEGFAQPFDLLLGRKTYEIFAAHWPNYDDDIGRRFNAVTKYVATNSLDTLSWENSVALRGDAAAEIARLKSENGPDLLTQGSSVLLQALLAHQLVDELRLLTFPLVLGSGKRLFGDGAIAAGLELIDSRTSTTGVIISRYRLAGAIVPGSFALHDPTEAELARREKMKREG